MESRIYTMTIDGFSALVFNSDADLLRIEELTSEEVGKVMTEQARAALVLSFSKKLGRVKEMPPPNESGLPKGAALVAMLHVRPKS